MPYRPDAPDIVIPCRSGENRELRYALRSLDMFFPYRHIWIVGSWPRWVRPDHPHLTTIRRPTLRPKYRTTRAHYRWACDQPDVTDPWVMWNDDFFLLRPITKLPHIHRGRIRDIEPQFDTWQSKWAIGLRETHRLLRRIQPRRTLYSYDIHTPLLCHKNTMLRALDLADEMNAAAPHVRTIYGNLQHLGGTSLRDPKTYSYQQLSPGQTWLSSHENTFTTAVEPHLRAIGLTQPSPYEIPGIPDAPSAHQPPTAQLRADRKRRMRYRVLPGTGGNKIVPDTPDTHIPTPAYTPHPRTGKAAP